ncbi:GNAT family N-acetyltransferase [Brumimicrobium salinarum]|uniref:GNAT family N-acetyltransferase n=1 Tax=Brumimicrobium salinarum TaxID=2058658 RepID=A0A2I0R1N2_9FLAO|nr:GNAT family N-acetyltransferase [Brumimicrobium salinarum]PKR80476.1 GNAT family N-acetyltransferase [Brumimicrobium salinarum]
MLSWQFKHFEDLDIYELYDLLALRVKVFVVEQNCPYQELDHKDQVAFHLVARNKKGNIVGTMRILPRGVSYEEISFGRIVLDKSEREKQFGDEMIEKAMDYVRTVIGKYPIRLSAQKHLENFYKKHKFVSTGKEYLEDNIPHVEMIYKP